MRIRYFFIVMSLIFLPAPAMAQTLQDAQNQLNCIDYSLGKDPNSSCDAQGNIVGANATNSQDAIFTVLDDIITRLPFYLTIIAFFALLYSGGMYIFALGDATKMETAKKNITWAAIGIIVIALIGITIRVAYSISQKSGGYIQSVNDIEGITK